MARIQRRQESKEGRIEINVITKHAQDIRALFDHIVRVHLVVSEI